MHKIFKYSLIFFGLIFQQSLVAQMANPVTWKSSVERISGDEFWLVMQATIEKDWHMYSQYTPDGGVLPTVFEFKYSKKDYQLIGKTVEPKYKIIFNDIFNVNEYYFDKSATFKQKIKVTNPKLKTVSASIDFQACKESCIFYSEDFVFQLPEITPAVVEENKVEVTENLVVANENAQAETVQEPKQVNKANLQTKTSEEQNTNPLSNQWNLFIFSLIAGILVTFTPCVFPMVPMTVSYFIKQSSGNNQSKGKSNAVMYGVFIILIYVLISLPFHLFQKISPTIFYEFSVNPWLNIFFFLVFLIFAISFLGAFEITMPASLANKVDGASNKSGLIGIFFMALTLIIVSFSCTGPVLGLVLGSVLSTDGGATLLTLSMLGFGLGLALPFMLFALFPSFMGNIPKSGGWLNTVKVVFGFIELALAFKFLSMADLVMDWHILEREVFLAIWIAIFLALAMYLFGKISFPHDSPITNISVGRGLLGLASLTFAIYMIPGLWGAPLNLISGFPPPMSYSESPKGVGYQNVYILENDSNQLPEGAHYGPQNIVSFLDYDLGLAYAKKVNKPVMIDFTGKTCVNCRRMEEKVWSEPDILNLLMNEVVLISLYVDDRKPLPENEIYTNENDKLIDTYGKKWNDFSMKRYKANVQPYYVLMAHDESNLNEPVGYTPDAVIYKNWLTEGITNFKEK